MAEGVRDITAIGMQHPDESRVVLEADHVNKDTIMDFHEGKYTLADSASVLMHQVLAADNLGDDLLLNYICRKLDISFGRINGSNTSYEVKMALRDRMRLKQIVPTLKTSQLCFVCKNDFIGLEEVTAYTPCCDRTFRRNCLFGVSTCPFCNEPWGGLPCAVCNKPTFAERARHIYATFRRRRTARMECCGVDVHSRCRRFVCPNCNNSKFSNINNVEFVTLRQER